MRIGGLAPGRDRGPMFAGAGSFDNVSINLGDMP